MIAIGSGGLGDCRLFGLALPIPRQQFVNGILRVGRDAGEDVGEPCLGIDIVEASGLDQRDHDGGAFGATVRSGEQPCPSAQSQTPQGSLCRIVKGYDAFGAPW